MTSVGVAVWLVRLWILLLDATPMLFKIVLSVRADRPYEMLPVAQQQREINLARSLTHRHEPQQAATATDDQHVRGNGQHPTQAGSRRRGPYPTELRRQAVQMVHDTKPGANSQWEAIVTVARALGPSPETIRTWVRQADTHHAPTDPPSNKPATNRPAKQ